MTVGLTEYQKKIGTGSRIARPQSSGGETVSLQSGETLADLKPRMVLGYCSLI
jgi:hypothetical protein